MGRVQRKTHQMLTAERCPTTRQAFAVCGNMTSKQSVHRPVAGQVLHQLCGTPKTPCAGRTPVRLLPHRCAALLGNRRPTPNSSEERTGGEKLGSKCRCRWWPKSEKKKKQQR